MARVWNGTISPASVADHEAFVDWLRADEGQLALGRALLSVYRLRRQGDRLTVEISAEDPLAIIRFLRNRRFWPDGWTFVSASPSDSVAHDAEVIVDWRKGATSTVHPVGNQT